MPKQNFFNLPEERRQAILDIVIDELTWRWACFNFAHPKLERVFYRALYTDHANQLEATAKMRETPVNTGGKWWSRRRPGVNWRPTTTPSW